jgi:hypothetical protein
METIDEPIPIPPTGGWKLVKVAPENNYSLNVIRDAYCSPPTEARVFSHGAAVVRGSDAENDGETTEHTAMIQKIIARAAEFHSEIEALRTGFDCLSSTIAKLDGLLRGENVSNDDLERLWGFVTDVDRATCLVRYADNPIALTFLGEKLNIDPKSLTHIVDDVLTIEREVAKQSVSEMAVSGPGDGPCCPEKNMTQLEARHNYEAAIAALSEGASQKEFDSLCKLIVLADLEPYALDKAAQAIAKRLDVGRCLVRSALYAAKRKSQPPA